MFASQSINIGEPEKDYPIFQPLKGVGFFCHDLELSRTLDVQND
jgi:hypothetical protein